MKDLFEYFESPDWHVCKDAHDTPKKNGIYLVVYEDDNGKYVAKMKFNTNYEVSFLYEPNGIWYRLGHKAWMPYSKCDKKLLKPLK